MLEKIVSFIFLGFLSIVVLKYIFLSFLVLIGELIRKHKCGKQIDIASEENASSVKKVKFFRIQSLIWRFYKGCVRYLTYKISLFPSNFVRLFFYRNFLHMKIGKNVVIHFRAEIRDGYKIEIGDNTIIGDNCILDGRKGIQIGKNVNISSNVSIYTLEHDKNDRLFGVKGEQVIIGDKVWVAANAIVLPGVKTGEGAIICGGAVVTKEVGSFKIFAGIPAKEIGERTDQLEYEFKEKPAWFY